MEYTNIKLEKENRVATIRLDRPDALNALSPELLTELSSAVAEAGGDESIKALVVRGEGRAFCAGADLTYFQSTFDDPTLLPKYATQINDVLRQIESLPFPAIAVVHGFALAGGLELMMACDMVLVAEDARIGDQHVNFGLMPGGGSTQRLPRRVGLQRAMELLTTGKWISGAEAADWGLALRAVPADSLDEELETLLTALRTKSREGLALIKAVTLRGMGLSIEDGVALESHAFVQYMTTSPHPAEGIKAFIEKRQPEF
ncbi:MAG: enoyl-CoA hydratase/isomerase family protein [Chloroflexi bacterium]|nr:enoyl-CoA hydratase/isomerase family protein [Chloroflexota bacterium]MCI0898171.1 enoyl-CoA hydratase/isomerase family protein [Chloroflexota bacterium]MCI0902406.1 enoyl-CoA hydratase/isomerase family protein [Chloroflexota bacterium]